jgi:hypothetical protein
MKSDTLHEEVRKFIIYRRTLLAVEICGTNYLATHYGFFSESHVFFEIITRNTVQPWSPKKQLTIET